MKEDDSSKNLETNTDNDVLTIVDMEIYPGLAEEGIARQIINRVQKLRKTAGLQPTDDIKMEYKVLSDPDEIGLAKVLETHAAAFVKALRRPLDKHEVTQVDGEISAEKQGHHRRRGARDSEGYIPLATVETLIDLEDPVEDFFLHDRSSR